MIRHQLTSEASGAAVKATKLATLVYVRGHGRTLMLHRVRKANDMHAGKWNGLGGKLEQGETPEACTVREVWEESGLRIRAPEFRGMIVFPEFSGGEDWITFIFVAREFHGTLIDSNEGVLEWIDDQRLLDLPLWAGDRVFIPWLDRPEGFSACFVYEAGELQRWESTFYGPGGVVVRRESSCDRAANASAEGPASDPGATDDSVCWICGAPVIKRHCKIVCVECGFTRDCSDP